MMDGMRGEDRTAPFYPHLETGLPRKVEQDAAGAPAPVPGAGPGTRPATVLLPRPHPLQGSRFLRNRLPSVLLAQQLVQPYISFSRSWATRAFCLATIA